MRIFITGGTGNIGQYVSRALLDAGHQLVLLTRTPDRIPAYQNLPGVTVVRGNILELDVLRQAVAGCDAVIHIALGWGNDPVEMLEHDTKVTLFLLDAAERAGVGKFIYTSSTGAYGPLRDGMDETAQLLPDNLYGATKAASEHYVLGFNQYYSGQGVYGAPTNIRRNVIRPGYIFSNPAFEGGASQSDTRFLNIAKAVLQGEELAFSAREGTQFLSAGQIAQLYVRLVGSDLNKEVFMALGRKFVSWAHIARTAAQIAGVSSRITVTDEDQAPQVAYYNVDKMERVFGLSFQGDEELQEHIRWNVDRAREILEGKSVHNPFHVW